MSPCCLGQVCVNLVCHLVVWAVLGQVCGNWMCDFFVWAVFGQVCINPVCHLVLWAVLRQVCANLGSLLFVWALLKQVRVNPVVSPLMWAVFEQVCVNWCVIFLCEQCWDKSVLIWYVTLWSWQWGPVIQCWPIVVPFHVECLDKWELTHSVSTDEVLTTLMERWAAVSYTHLTLPTSWGV